LLSMYQTSRKDKRLRGVTAMVLSNESAA